MHQSVLIAVSVYLSVSVTAGVSPGISVPPDMTSVPLGAGWRGEAGDLEVGAGCIW